MNEDDVLKLLASGEGDKLEVKANVSDFSVVLKTACAMANAKGGHIVIGAEERSNPPDPSERFQLVGIPKLRNVLNRANHVGDQLVPQIKTDCDICNLSNGQVVLVISVPRFMDDEPVSLKDGSTWIRRGVEDTPGHIFKPVTARESVLVEQQQVIRTLLSTDDQHPTPEWISEKTGLPRDTVVGHLEQLKDAGAIKSLERTLDGGVHLIISSGNRIRLREMLGQPASEEPVEPDNRPTGGAFDSGFSNGFDTGESDPEPADGEASDASVPESITLDPQDVEVRTEVDNKVELSQGVDVVIEGGRPDSESLSDETAKADEQKRAAFESRKSALLDRFEAIDDGELDGFAHLIGVSEEDRATKNVRFLISTTVKHYSNELQLDQFEGNLNRFSSVTIPDVVDGVRHIGSRTVYRRHATADEECLNAQEYANVIAAFFSETPDDVCFGLFGHWGRGKTYLIDKVGEKLKASCDYSVVKFSAWKYRSTPELWAHLYESIAENARNSHWFLWLFTPFRAGLARYGAWPLILAFYGLAFSLLTLDDKLWIAQVVLQAAGIGGVCYLLFLYVRLQAFAPTISKYFAIAQHRSSLGLQATIGDDLRALLIGWMPQDRWIPHRVCKWKEWNEVANFCICMARAFFLRIRWVKLLAYLLGTGLVLYQLIPWDGEHYVLSLPFYGKITEADTSVVPWLAPIFFYIWILVSLVFPLLALLVRQGPTRVLLVVDDLDRCDSSQMLEIIESIMMFLDDNEMKQRLQIAMLVEEESIESAIKKKYQRLWDGIKKDKQEAVKTRIITENIEKIFLAYLRLPTVTQADLENLFRTFLKVENELGEATPSEDQSESTPDDSMSGTAATPLEYQSSGALSEPLESMSNDARKRSGRTMPELQEDLHLGKAEQEAILEQVLSLEDDESRRWGPRAVRCFINRYQLARAILLALSPEQRPIPEELVESLLRKDELDDQNEILTGITKLEYVSRQVR